MKYFITIILIATISLQLMAQVGIGTTNPNSQSALDVYSKKKGLLVPRITDVGGADKTEGSLIYDSINGTFLYCHDQKWHDVSALVAENDGNVAELKSKYETLKANTFAGYGTIPVGGIIMWSGNEADLPDGWALCDGDVENGMRTPDLRGRFIVGSGSNGNNVPDHVWDASYADAGDLSEGKGRTNKGDTGSTRKAVLEARHLPDHWHYGSTFGSNDGRHNHVYKDSYFMEKYGTGYQDYQNWKKNYESKVLGFSERVYATFHMGSHGGFDDDNNLLLAGYRITDTDGVYNYSGYPSGPQYLVDEKPKNNGPTSHHKHQILTSQTLVKNSVGSTTPNDEFDNRPPYYALAFIMRVK
ncbi:MAG: phage tail protein [Bacteroidales bacterium]|nr:phage tail protein [Bacteroidales bacterium]